MTSDSKDASAVSEIVLQRRLDAGLAIAGGARGSLTKAMMNAASSSAPLLHLEMTKLALIIQRNERLLQQQNPLQSEETTEAASLKEMRSALETAKAQHECWQTYEGLAKAIVEKHVISEAQLNEDIDMIDEQHELAKEQLATLKTTVKARVSQCHLLQQCVQDLQQSVNEDRIAKQEDHAKLPPVADKVDDVVMKDASDDEEGELYGDLDNHL